MQCYPTMWRLKEWLTLGAEQDLTICRTGSLAEGRSSVSAQTRTQTSLLSVLQHCPWQVPLAVLPSWDTGTLPFLPLHHLLTFTKETLFLGFFTSTSPQNSHPCTVLWMFWCRIGMKTVRWEELAAASLTTAAAGLQEQAVLTDDWEPCCAPMGLLSSPGDDQGSQSQTGSLLW